MLTRTKNRIRFGDWLISKGLLTEDQLADILTEQRRQGGRLGEIISRLNIMTEPEVENLLDEYLAIKTVRLNDITEINLDDITKIDINIATLIQEEVATRFCVLAIAECDNRIVLAMANPLDVVAVDTIRGKLGRDITPVLCTEREIRHAIDVIYHGCIADEQSLRELVKLETGLAFESENDRLSPDVSIADISGEADADKPPIIRFVDLLLSQAVKSHASDIHIEPQDNSMVIRMRVDGLLRAMVPPARKMQPAVIARIKILSNMDIAERRIPQDGRFKIKHRNGDIDVRVSTIPTIYGEKIVMRILDSSAVNHDIDALGLKPRMLKCFKHNLSQPHGIIIVTGPTGSGKTTTLYAGLNFLRDPRKNITTVEDPVEYRLKGVNQIQVRSDIDLDFASCLRAILRQDPDIITIGEIRDTETIEIAIKSSLTGHLVLSTFHTNDAPSAISRMVNMGTERYLLASTVNLIVAQRLVRKICTQCKEEVKPDPELLKQLNVDSDMIEQHRFYAGKGCGACDGTGYKGRLPIFEFLPLNAELREQIAHGASESKIREINRTQGFGNLMDSGVERLLAGETTARGNPQCCLFGQL